MFSRKNPPKSRCKTLAIGILHIFFGLALKTWQIVVYHHLYRSKESTTIDVDQILLRGGLLDGKWLFYRVYAFEVRTMPSARNNNSSVKLMARSEFIWIFFFEAFALLVKAGNIMYWKIIDPYRVRLKSCRIEYIRPFWSPPRTFLLILLRSLIGSFHHENFNPTILGGL